MVNCRFCDRKYAKRIVKRTKDTELISKTCRECKQICGLLSDCKQMDNLV